MRRGSSPTSCGSSSSHLFRGRSDASAARVERDCPTRQALEGMFVLHTGIAWTHLPQELGFGSRGSPAGVAWTSGSMRASGSGCMRSCSRGSEPLVRSSGRGRSSTRARSRRKKGLRNGPSPVDRGRPGSKHHLLVDASGIPLAWSLTGGNRNDATQLIPLSRRCRRSPACPAIRADAQRVSPQIAATTTTSTAVSSATGGSNR